MVYPNASAADFCDWLLNDSEYNWSGPRLAIINAVNAAAIGQTSVTDNEWKMFNMITSFLWLRYQQFLNLVISNATADVLRVGAGGGGGTGNSINNASGGGGGGEFSESMAESIPVGSYSVIIGIGGAGANSVLVKGSTGGTTSFNSISAAGGGGGGSQQSNAGGAGASGGGAAYNASGGSASAGYAGGNNLTPYVNGGGGGGGAAAAGSNQPANQTGGAGGAGLQSSISLSSIYYAAGGGAGATTTLGVGGSSSGGSGSNSSTAPTIPTANSGSGGGGSHNIASYVPTSGADGIVIIRYVTGTMYCVGGFSSISGSYTYHVFTSSGTFTRLQ